MEIASVGRNTKQPDKRIKRPRGVFTSRRATEQLGSTAEQVGVVGRMSDERPVVRVLSVGGRAGRR